MDSIQFLLQNAKQSCSKSFQSHLPHQKWCEKQKARDDKVKYTIADKLVEELINNAVENSEEEKENKCMAEEIVSCMLDKALEQAEQKKANNILVNDLLNGIVSKSIETIVSKNMAKTEDFTKETKSQDDSSLLLYQVDGSLDPSSKSVSSSLYGIKCEYLQVRNFDQPKLIPNLGPRPTRPEPTRPDPASQPWTNPKSCNFSTDLSS